MGCICICLSYRYSHKIKQIQQILAKNAILGPQRVFLGHQSGWFVALRATMFQMPLGAHGAAISTIFNVEIFKRHTISPLFWQKLIKNFPIEIKSFFWPLLKAILIMVHIFFVWHLHGAKVDLLNMLYN